MDIERLATSAVVDSISLTDVLSPFINDGDKEPSWDGNIYIYEDKRKTKKGIKKVPVQVKGELRKRIQSTKSRKYSISVVDLDNWLNDGGVLLFVVFINESGTEKAVYYSSLLPVKIRNLKKFSRGKRRITVQLTQFPDDNNRKVAVLLDFYANMKKQTSFANAPLFTIDELSKQGVLENVSFSVSTYGKNPSGYEIESLLLHNDIYMYANIKGSPIPQPLPDLPMDIHISRDIQGEIKVKDQVFYQNYRIVRYAEGADFHFGKSFSLKLFEQKKQITINFSINGTLTDYICDTECLIAILECEEITINGAQFPLYNIENVDIEQYKQRLSYYKDVKKMLDLLGVKEELECKSLSDLDQQNIRNFVNAVVYGKQIGFTGCMDNMLYGRFMLGNLSILIWADKDADKGYKVQSFFGKHTIALFEADDEKRERPHAITHYVLLKKQDFLDCANIDYQKIRNDLGQNDTLPIVTEQVTLFMLEMLKAYDTQETKDEELLSTAEHYCNWLMEKEDSPSDMMTLNHLQIEKRKRTLNEEEILYLQKLRNPDHDLMTRCAANLLLGKNESAQDCFDEMDEELQELFIAYPICSFGNLELKKPIDDELEGTTHADA